MSYATTITLLSVGIVGGAALAALKAIDYARLRRLRALKCPTCQSVFDVPSTVAVKRWVEVSVDPKDRSTTHGFILHCPRCGRDYRFTDDYQPQEPAAPSNT